MIGQSARGPSWFGLELLTLPVRAGRVVLADVSTGPATMALTALLDAPVGDRRRGSRPVVKSKQKLKGLIHRVARTEGRMVVR